MENSISVPDLMGRGLFDQDDFRIDRSFHRRSPAPTLISDLSVHVLARGGASCDADSGPFHDLHLVHQTLRGDGFYYL